MSSPWLEQEIEPGLRPVAVCGAFRRPGSASVFLDGDGTLERGWFAGLRPGAGSSDELPFSLVGLEPRVLMVHRGREQGTPDRPLSLLDRLLHERRSGGGPPGTGLAVLLAYDLLDPEPSRGRDDDGLPELLVLAVDASVRFGRQGPPVLTVRGEAGSSRISAQARLDRLLARLYGGPGDLPPPEKEVPDPRPRTSLPREAYLRALEQVRIHIRRGDIYQANVTQRFSVCRRGDALDLYRRLVAATPAPRSAFIESQGFAVASVSPETFLRVLPDGTIGTFPIKGTRPRGTTEEEDRAAASALLSSAKDRAELLMIVDLERNDLGRVCRTGSVCVPELASLRTFAAVHHLVARVQGKLLRDIGPTDLLRATFPGGSVTGAPKIRAMEILRKLEPVRRNFYTGSLMWFGDDGSTESSILIRSVVLTAERAFLGAGGGVVADSEPKAEWGESNDKARALARVLGFVPEEAV